MRITPFLFCFIVLLFNYSSYGQLVELPLSKRIGECQVLVEGQVLSSTSYETINKDFIYTVHTIRVEKVFKGANVPDLLFVATPGGQVGNRMIIVDHVPELHEGERGLFFFAPANLNLADAAGQPFAGSLWACYGEPHGFIYYDELLHTAVDPFHVYKNIQRELYDVITAQTGHGYENRYNPAGRPGTANRTEAIAISSFSPSVVNAGTQQRLVINGSGFGDTRGTNGNLFLPDADRGGATLLNTPSSHIISWSDTRIEIVVPDFAGTGSFSVRNDAGETIQSASRLTVNFAISELDDSRSGQGKNARLVNLNSSGGYTLIMNQAFAADAGAPVAFRRALTNWRCTKGINFALSSSTTAVNSVARDNVSVIRFDVGSELPAGVLGRTSSYYEGCFIGSSPTEWRVSEIDMSFDAEANWGYTESLSSTLLMDFESVTVHELGHAIQLGHVINPGAVMHYSIMRGTTSRTLSSNDQAAAETVLSYSTQPVTCGPAGMTRVPAAECSLSSGGSSPVADFSATPLSVCTGGTVTFTDRSTGATSRTWSFPGGTPSTSTAASPTVTYATAGTYTATLTVSNSSGSNTQTRSNYITVNTPPAVNLGSDLALCSGGAVTLDAGNPGATYKWSTGATTQQIRVSEPGTYSVEVTRNGCKASGSVRVQVAAQTVANAGADVTICQGGRTTLSASGGSTYAWSPATGLSDPASSTPVASPSATTTYTVTVSSAGGCPSSTDQVTVFVVSPPTVNLGNDIVSCAGKEVVLDAGNPGAQYKWSNGSTAQTLRVTQSGTYTVEVVANGCTSSDMISVSFASLPKAAWTFAIDPAEGRRINFQNTSTEATSYVWDFGDGTFSNETNPVHVYKTGGNFLVSLTATNSCGNNVATSSVTSVVSGIEDEIAQSIEVYPNPAAGSFNLVFHTPRKKGNLALTNILGKIVYEQSLKQGQDNYEIKLPNQPEGIYLLIMELDQYRVIKRVVIR